MDDVDLLQYPRGFVLTDSTTGVPESFKRCEAIRELWVHPWVEVRQAVASNRVVVVIGTCATTEFGEWADPAKYLLSELNVGEDRFFGALGECVGRYAVIFGWSAELKIVTDATGMRSVYFSSEEGVAGSHARLISETIGSGYAPKPQHFHFGFPGFRTPFSGVRLLPPNSFLNLRSGRVERFWPERIPPVRTVDEVASETIELAVAGILQISAHRTVRLALTSGLDSRLMLALLLRSGIDFNTYTYGSDWRTALDRAFAADLAGVRGLRHSVIPASKPNVRLAARLSEASYLRHHFSVVENLMSLFPGQNDLAVTGNLLEIGRRFFAPMIRAGVAPPNTPETMAELYWLKMSRKVRARVDAAGRSEWMAVVSSIFSEYMDETDFASASSKIDPYDLFYWEHRMGAWHGAAMNERDFYAEAFIPLNVRNIFELMLGLNEASREDGSVFYRIIEMIDSSLLDFPVNPKQWPVRLQ